jgi:5-methylcytosine-specific restriction endonuclease McrA
MDLSPKLRFRILVRDRFTCCYCGRRRVSELDDNDVLALIETAPEAEKVEILLRQQGSVPDVELNVERIVPESAGGTDESGNLKTICSKCSGGNA